MVVKYHRPSLKLEQLQAECQGVQVGIPAKLVHLQAANVEVPVNNQNKFNQGQYVEVGIMDKVPTLKFEKVENPSDIPSMIADALKLNYLLIFDELLYIENQTQRVLGFGKS